MTEPIPRTLLDELKEIAGDLAPDLTATFPDMPEDVGRYIRQTIVELFRMSGDDVDLLLQHLSSLVMWLFMVGREHAIRGYPPPVGKSDHDDGIVPDDISDL